MGHADQPLVLVRPVHSLVGQATHPSHAGVSVHEWPQARLLLPWWPLERLQGMPLVGVRVQEDVPRPPPRGGSRRPRWPYAAIADLRFPLSRLAELVVTWFSETWLACE